MSAPADIGLNPPRSTKVLSRSGIMADALAQFGSVLVSAATTNSAEMQTTTSAGATNVTGVVGSQGDPNNSGLFAIGDEATVVELGDHPVLVLGGTTLAVGDALITSTTAGVCKKLAGETGACIVGYSLQAITTGSASQLVSCRLALQVRGS